MPVVAAGELQDPVAASRRAGEPDRAHRRLGPRRDEPHLVDRRHRIDDLRGELDLGLRRRPEARSALDRLDDRGNRLVVGVAEEERAPGHHPVDVAVAVDVLDVRAVAAPHEHRLVEPDRAHRANRRVDAAGDQLERAAV